jgi:hypothetical protein
MTSNINIEINGKDVSDKNSTSLLAFETHIDNLHLSRHEGEMMRKQIKAITNSYLDLIPKRSRTGEPRDTVTIPRKEYEEMKATSRQFTAGSSGTSQACKWTWSREIRWATQRLW